MTTKYNMKLTDAEIIKGIREQDVFVLKYIYEHFGSKILGFVLKNSGCEVDADAVISYAISIAWEKIHLGKYKNQGKFGAFLMRIAYNYWQDELRKRKKKITVSVPEFHEFTLSTLESNNDKELKQRKMGAIQVLGQMINKLTKKEQEIVELVYFEKYRLKEVAEKLNITHNFAKQKIMRVRKKLKRMMLGSI